MGALFQRPGECALCGGRDFTPTEYRDLFGTGANLVECDACGFRQYDRVLMTAEAFNDSPASHQMFDDSFRCGALNNRDPERADYYRAAHRSYYRGMLELLMALVGEPCAALYEVGVGYGEFLGGAQAAGLRVRGCEMNGRGVDLAREHFGVPVDFGAFQTVAADGPYDAVVALDVLEHTETPREDVERAARLLRPGGVLLIKTFYDEWHAGRELSIVSAEGWQLPHGYFDPVCHLNHFTEPVLRGLLERSGFDVAAWERDEVNGLVTAYARRRP